MNDGTRFLNIYSINDTINVHKLIKFIEVSVHILKVVLITRLPPARRRVSTAAFITEPTNPNVIFNRHR